MADLSNSAIDANRQYLEGKLPGPGFHVLEDPDGDVFLIALKKGEESYTFTCRPDTATTLLPVIGSFLYDERMSFSWEEASYLSQQLSNFIRGVADARMSSRDGLEPSVNMSTSEIFTEEPTLEIEVTKDSHTYMIRLERETADRAV